MAEAKYAEKRKFENCFKFYSDRIFIIDQTGKKITYKAFFDRVLKIIIFLKKIGCKKESKILILSENSVNYLATLAACVFGGFTACPLDPSIKNLRLKNIKKLYKAKFLLKNLDNLGIDKIHLGKNCNNIIDYRDTDCLMLSSYGPKGEARGILFKSSSIINSAQSFSKLAVYNKKTTILHCLPMFYMGGILDTFFSPIFSGSKIIVGEKFSILNAKDFWTLPLKNNCNTLFLTPSIVAFITTIFRKPSNEILKHVSKYRSIFATGSTLYPEVRKKFYEIFKKKIFSCYGTSEIGGPLSIQGRKDSFKDYCVGNHSKKIKILVKKINNNKINNIFVKTPFFMKGYLTTKGIKRPLDKNGYYNTGDLGDYKKKLIFIKDTDRPIIKKGGELISLDLVENTAKEVKGVSAATAVGKKDFFAGQELYLFVVFNQKVDESKKTNEIHSILKKKLRPIEVPKKILVVSKLNMTFSRKILRDKLINLL